MAESEMLTLDVLFDRLEQMLVPEGYKVEIVGGSIFLSPQHGQHWDIIFNIAEQLRAHYARKRLSSDVRYDFPGYLNGFCPDLAALKEGAEKDDQGQYAYDDIEFVLEVISKPTAVNDYGPKKAVYAEAGTGVYLIVDPYTRRCRLFTNPVDGEYKDEVTVTFGKPLDLTDTVVGLTLTTDDFEDD
jgi:Uma2 family endonuclease